MLPLAVALICTEDITKDITSAKFASGVDRGGRSRSFSQRSRRALKATSIDSTRGAAYSRSMQVKKQNGLLARRLFQVVTRPGRALSWAISFIIFTLCTIIRFALSDWLAPVPFITFFPAILVASLLCGWTGGLVILALAAGVAWSFFIPSQAYAVPPSHASIQLLVFLLVGVVVVIFVAALVDLMKRLRAAALLQEGLFRELQHRVANNMQIITAMLHLTRTEVKDEAALEVLDRAAARIGSMARLHRRLYDQEAYERGLEPILREALHERFRDVAVDVRLDLNDEDLSLDQRMSILFLVNEAAMNAAKHVFSRRRGGRFEVFLTEPAKGQLCLVIRDDGPGLSNENWMDGSSASLGMTIMRAFAAQLGGTLRILEGPGTGLGVEFPARRAGAGQEAAADK
jgi:two-component sensor histidine kinase